MKIYINLDCLADSTHRSDLMNSSFDEYHAAQIDDEPNVTMRQLLECLEETAEVFVYTTMDECFEYQVQQWLMEHGFTPDALLCGGRGRTVDVVLDLLEGSGANIVIDSRPATCDALREAGYFVMEV